MFDCKFPEFLFGKVKLLIGCHFLIKEAFGLSFPNGGSTWHEILDTIPPQLLAKNTPEIFWIAKTDLPCPRRDSHLCLSEPGDPVLDQLHIVGLDDLLANFGIVNPDLPHFAPTCCPTQDWQLVMWLGRLVFGRFSYKLRAIISKNQNCNINGKKIYTDLGAKHVNEKSGA